MTSSRQSIVVGVLALQGAFSEHIQLLKSAFLLLDDGTTSWTAAEVRTPEQLASCDALIIPGGESTTMALVAARSGLLEPLRTFVKVDRKPAWGTCAGMILLAEAANRTKQGGQDLIGGLDVKVNRNYFGRQVESFEQDLDLPFLAATEASARRPFKGVFIRAPVVEKTLPMKAGIQDAEQAKSETVIAPSRASGTNASRKYVGAQVEIMATLPGRDRLAKLPATAEAGPEDDIVAVRQGNVFATSFHPELTDDARIHTWWLYQVRTQCSGELTAK